MLHYLSHLFWCFPINLDRTFRVALILHLIKLLLLILLLKRPNLALKKERRDLRFLPPPLFFFLFSSTVFIPICIADPQLASGGIAVSTLWCLFIWAWNQAHCFWGLLSWFEDWGFSFPLTVFMSLVFLSLLGWCSHLSDTYQSKTSIVFCGTRFYFLLLICYKWIWIACKTKEMRQVIVFFSLSEKDLGDLL